jgi:hypothetical protein
LGVVDDPVLHGCHDSIKHDEGSCAPLAAHREDWQHPSVGGKKVKHRQCVIRYLEQCGHGLDAGAAAQQRRRLAAIDDRRSYRNQP